MPGDVLFRIADHSVVWAMVDVAERDLAAVREGQPVMVRVRSYPDRTFPGTVALVYPHLNPATRTVRVRIELANPHLLLKPDMYAEAEIDTGGGNAGAGGARQRGHRQRRSSNRARRQGRGTL